MRLLHVVSSYLPAVRYGGTIVSVHGLCRALAERGHDVHVYTTSVDGDLDSDVTHGQAVDIDGVKVWYFRSPSFRKIYRAPELAAALGRNVASFDIVHTHAIFLWPLWAAARAARNAGVPYVVSPRGMLERDLISAKSTLLKGLWIAAIERRNLEGAAALHVTSHREAVEAGAFGLSLPPMREIPNGVTLNAAGDGEVSDSLRAVAQGEPFVLFLGRISWKKGLDRLIAALPHIGARLVIAGNDDERYRPVLEGIADRFGVRHRMVFTGPVHGAGKAMLLRHARLLVLPSYSENFGNVVIEAMAEACPVVVSTAVGVASVVEATGAGLAVPGDSSSLVTAIERLLNDPAARQEMGRRGARAAREQFSWTAVAQQMEALYATLIPAAHA